MISVVLFLKQVYRVRQWLQGTDTDVVVVVVEDGNVVDNDSYRVDNCDCDMSGQFHLVFSDGQDQHFMLAVEIVCSCGSGWHRLSFGGLVQIMFIIIYLFIINCLDMPKVVE